MGTDPLRLLHDPQRGQIQAKVRLNWTFPPKLGFVGVFFAETALGSAGRMVEDAVGGRFLNDSFSLPCPPGLNVPPEVFSPFTANNLKVCVREHLQPVK